MYQDKPFLYSIDPNHFKTYNRPKKTRKTVLNYSKQIIKTLRFFKSSRVVQRVVLLVGLSGLSDMYADVELVKSFTPVIFPNLSISPEKNA